jgi:PAS domain S-box-containing protein
LSRTSGRSVSRLAAILDALPDALLLVDSVGTVVNANAVALELFEGESAERLLGKPVVTLLPGLGRGVATTGRGPAALPPGSSAGGTVAAATGPRPVERSRPERLGARRTDGSMFPAEVSTAKLPDDEDELTLYVVRDLTGVLDVEAELRRQQRQIELILRAASEGIIGVDHEGRIVLVNPAGARILRHRAGELGGQDVHELIAHSAADGTPIPRDRCLLIDSLKTGTKHRSSDEVLWRSDGTSVTVDLATAPVLEGETIIGAVMTFQDNSEARTAARRARELAEVLEDDLRGPLNSVLADLRGVAGYGIGELGPSVRQALASATSDLAEVAELVEDIVDYQQMVVGDVPCERVPVSLAQIVDDAVAATEPAAAEAAVDLVAHAADVEVMVDPDLFTALVAHLLADMVTASPVGGKVVVTAARRGPVARIEIRGPHTGGGPLHVPIARAIAARHGGTVTTHRIAGKGNTHVVEVPLEGSTGSGRSGREAEKPERALPAVRRRALTTARVRTAPPPEPTAEPEPPKQLEKSNGHHTSHGADARRGGTAVPPPAPPGQAHIPAQSRSTLSRTFGAGGVPLDLKPSKPLPTSDVWTRPGRGADEVPPGESTVPVVLPGIANGEMRPDASGSAHDLQQPWQPEAEKPAEQQAAPDQATPTQTDAQPRGRRRAITGTAGEGAPLQEQPVQEKAAALSAAPMPTSANSASAVSVTTVVVPQSGGAQPDGQKSSRPTVNGAPREEAPTQSIPPVMETSAASLTPVPSTGAQGPARAAAAPREPAPQQPVLGGPQLLMWPEPDTATLGLLSDRGYATVVLETHDGLPVGLGPEGALVHRRSPGVPRSAGVLVDPIAAPITRRGLRALRGAAIDAGLPLLVTAGIGGAPSEAPAGPDPALLLQALIPAAVSLPRVLLVEARDDLAEAMMRSLERQGMQVMHAATDSESVSRAADGFPDVVVMDLMQVRRRRVGIVEWLRDRDRLTMTPLVVYTALGTDTPQFGLGLRTGEMALYLAERSTEGDVGGRIVDLLAKTGGGVA